MDKYDVLKSKWTEDETIELATSLLQRAYYEMINDLAKEAIEEAKENDWERNSEELDTWLNESIDGHAWVIYTGKNHIALYCSNQEPEMDLCGNMADGVNYAIMAYSVIEQDVAEALEREWPVVMEVK